MVKFQQRTNFTRTAGLSCMHEGDAPLRRNIRPVRLLLKRKWTLALDNFSRLTQALNPKMSISTVICQLQSLTSKTDLLAKSIRGIKSCQTKEQYEELDALKTKLQEATAEVASAVVSLEHETAERVRTEGKSCWTRPRSL